MRRLLILLLVPLFAVIGTEGVQVQNPGELINQLLTGATADISNSQDDKITEPSETSQRLSARLNANDGASAAMLKAARRQRTRPAEALESRQQQYGQQQNWGANDNNNDDELQEAPVTATYRQRQKPKSQSVQTTSNDYETEVAVEPAPTSNSNSADAADNDDQSPPSPSSSNDNDGNNNNIYAAPEAAPPPPQQPQYQYPAPAKKPSAYDPTPYADTLYCLDCQDKCSLQLAPQCPTGRGWYKYYNSCYYFEPSIQLAWREARGFCAGLTDETGTQRGHLVIINDARENEFLRSLHHYLQKGGFPTMFWTDLASTNVSLNASADPLAMTADANSTTANNGTTTMSASATLPVEWYTYQALGFVSHFRSMFNTFAAATGSCGILQYNNNDAIERLMLQSELYWGLDDCASQRPPLCEIDLDGNPFN